MKNSFKITAIVSSILLSATLATPAIAAETPVERASTTTSLTIPKAVVAESADISYTPEIEIPTVERKAPPAPVAVETVPAAVQPAIPVTSVPVNTPTAQTPAPALPVATPTYQTYSAAPAAPTPAAAPQQTASGPVAGGLVASARSQVGVAQDCTAMVENALRSVGKSVGDLAPAQFFQYGSVVGSPAPGDLVITSGHVAIYVGGGQVVSGGLNGMNTGVHPLSDLPGASFVRVS